MIFKGYTPFIVIKNNGYIPCAVQYILAAFLFLVFVPLNPLALSCPPFPSPHWYSLYLRVCFCFVILASLL